MDAHRKRRLLFLLDSQFGGNRGELIRKSGLSKGRITQLLDTSDSEPFGERAARNLEAKLGLPDRWFDREDGLSVAVRDDIVIPQYKTGGRMGSAGLVLRDQPGVIRSWNVSPEYARSQFPPNSGLSNLCIVTGFGPSMMPKYNPGDPLLVDTGVRTVEYDAVYFFSLGNEGLIKLLGRTRRAQLVRLQQCGFDQLRRCLGLLCHPLRQPLGQAQRHVYSAQSGRCWRASTLVHFGHVAASHKP